MIAVETEEILDEQIIEDEMPTFNHSNICTEIIEQILENRTFKPLPELTLDIENGLTPDISVYLREKVKPDYWNDIIRYGAMPILAIEIISPSQSVQSLIEKADNLIKNGIKVVWVVEPVTKAIVVVDENGKKAFQNEEIESEGIRVDFRKIFGNG